MSQRVLLLGTGYTLRRVAVLLGKELVVLTSRDADRVAAWRAHGFEVQQLDPSDVKQLRGLFALYPLLDTVIDSTPPELTDPTLVARTLVSAAPQTIGKIVYLSTTGVFGVDDGSWVDELTVANPVHERGAARLAVEQLYQTHSSQLVTLRIPAIYGPGRGLGLSLQRHAFPLIEDGSRWSNRIHVEDLARVVARTVPTHWSAKDSVVCVSDDQPAPTHEVVQYYCQKFQLPQPASITREEAIARGFTSLLSNQRVRNVRMRELLGETLLYPTYREGAGVEFSRDSVLL